MLGAKIGRKFQAGEKNMGYRKMVGMDHLSWDPNAKWLGCGVISNIYI